MMEDIKLEVLQVLAINLGGIVTGITIASNYRGRVFFLAINVGVQFYNTYKLIKSLTP